MIRIRNASVSVLFFASLPLVASMTGCSKDAPEPSAINRDPVGSASAGFAGASTGGAGVLSSSPARPPRPTPGASASPDPLGGKWSLADATKDLPGKGTLYAEIGTDKGNIECKLLEDKAPITVANFVGLARGLRPWLDSTGAWVTQPAYDGTVFHRIIKGFMIQGGDATGAKLGRPGTGEPGYVIPDEKWPGATHDHAGQLCMANRGPNTNGAQFFITDGAPKYLDTGYTIFGDCTPTSRVTDIASAPTHGDQAVTPTVISKVTIVRK